jgi:hypothetical protein
MRRMIFQLVVATSLIGLTITFGWWPASVATGGLFALLPSVHRPVWLAFFSGVLGWGLPLAVQSVTGKLFSLAKLLGEIFGLGGIGGVVVLLLPPLVGGLLALSGAWVASAVKQVARTFKGTSLPAQADRTKALS